MHRFTGTWARRSLRRALPSRRIGDRGRVHRATGLRARLERERLTKQYRTGKRVRLSRRNKWVLFLLFLLSLLACAAGGWLGMHYHHYGDAAVTWPASEIHT